MGRMVVVVVAHNANLSLPETEIHTRAILCSDTGGAFYPIAEIRNIKPEAPIGQLSDCNRLDGVAECITGIRSG